MTSFTRNNSFTYVLRIIILDVSDRAREKGEGITTASRMYHKKIKENREPLAVARLLFLTSNLQIPSTVYSSI